MLIYKLLESATKLIINKLMRNKYIYNYSSLLCFQLIIRQACCHKPFLFYRATNVYRGLPSKTAEGKFFMSLHKNDFSPR